MLRGCHDTLVLDALDGLRSGDTLEYRVAAEALPVAAASGQSSERAHSRTQQNVDALEASFFAMSLATLVHELLVPGRSNSDTSGEGCDVVCETDAERAVLYHWLAPGRVVLMEGYKTG